jgi:gliding motility-associated-like protein
MTTLCFGQSNALLTATVTGGLPPYTYTWSNGSNSPSVNVGPGTYTVTINDNTNCPPTTATAVVNSFSLPITANAGPDQNLCKTSPNAVLNGTIGMAGGGIWSGGTGTFSPNNTALTMTYIPTLAEIATGSVQLTLTSTGNQGCPGASDAVTLFFQNPPLANAGSSMSVCANNNLISLSGSITGYSATPQWSSSGSGVFTSTSNLTTTYTPSNADITAGSVNFTLTTQNNGACPASSSTIHVAITPAPVVNAGGSQTICSNAIAMLSGSVTGPTNSGAWSTGGDGTFNPSPNLLNTTYIPGPNDINNGIVTLTLTSTGNGNCLPVTNTVVIVIKKLAVVNVSPSQTVCSNAGTISLTGTITGGTATGLWSTNGNGSFNPGPGSLNTAYNITPSDITMGTVNFTLSSTNNGPCPVTTNTLSVSIYQLAQVNAGPNQALCATSATVALNGTVNTGNGIWTSNGGGTYNPNQISLNTTYSFTPLDISNGFISFTLSSTNNGPCPVVSDSVMITIKKTATVNVSPNQTICSTTSSISLTGTITGGTSSGIWTTNGSGAFSPGPGSVNTSYFITPADITMGTVIFTLTSTNNAPCVATSNTLSLSIYQLAQVNAGPNQALCATSGTVALSGIVNTGNGIWTSNGGGTYNPNQISLNTTYSFTPADINNGSVIFTLSSTNNGPCPAISDSIMVTIKKTATVNVSPSQTICSTTSSISLTGTITGGTSSGIWTTNGSGAFSPGPGSLNTAYFITPADITIGTVIFTLTSTNNAPCVAASNTLSLSIYQLAQVNAGLNQALCETSGTVGLNGTVNTGNGVWTSNGGGTYNPNQISLNTTYSFTPADVNLGFVTFTLSSTNNGPCPTVSDSVMITIKKTATVNVCPSQTICSTTSSINITGTITGGTSTGTWTTNGSGAFNNGPGSLNNSYFVTPADVVMGTVIFTLTSTNNAPCAAVSNTLSLAIYQLAQVNAGPNQFLCESNGTVGLNGSVNTGNGVWTSNGGGTYNPNNISLSTTYSLTPADINNGSVTFTLSSTNNGPCPTISDSVKIAIKKMATVDAGTDQSICSTTGSISLNGIIGGGGTSAAWSTNGNGGFIPGPGSLNNSYIVSIADVGLGSVIFTLTSTNNGPCPAVSDTTMLKIYQLAQVSAGPNQALCETAGTVALAGFVNTGNGMWSGGTGTYTPDNTNLNATYSITGNDVNAGFVTFMLSSTNNGPCPAVNDTVKITLRKLAVVNAGGDKAVCSTNSTVFLSGNVSVGSNSGVWSGNGSGSFSPNNTSLNTTYSISGADMSAGSVTVVLTSLNNGVCPAVTDTTIIKIYRNPNIRLSQDTTVCTYQNPLRIIPNVSGDYGLLQWSTSGSGSFLPTNFANPVTYDFTKDIPSVVVTLSISALNNGPCANINASIKVTIRPSPTAQFSPSTYTVNIPNDPVTFNNHSFQANNYEWSFGDGSTSGAVNPVHNYQTVGYYNVTLVALNQFGCSDTAVDQIKVVSDIQFPNAFTPNTHSGNGGSFDVNDYSNDVFFPYTAYEGVTGYDLQIFNRWGELIFESKNVLQGWDGYFKGKLCQQDVYVWKAKVEFFDGRLYTKTGSVTLLR